MNELDKMTKEIEAVLNKAYYYAIPTIEDYDKALNEISKIIKENKKLWEQ